MSSLDFAPYRDDHFEISASFDGQRLVLRLSGNAELGVHEALGPLLLKGHDEAVRLKASEVVVDLGSLQFMNSSCFKQFVTWLARAQQIRDGAYRIRFLSNPRMRWQKASLAAISCFAPAIVSVETLPT